MAARRILRLGDPALYAVADELRREDAGRIEGIAADLRDTLLDFRERFGRGRAIAAPQIGERVRLVYMERPERRVLVNPVIADRSGETIDLWDDCMSFPDLIVKVRRNRRVRVEYRDTGWNLRVIEAGDDLSELLQHEIDHLDGVLATMRAIDERSFADAAERERVKRR